MGLSPEVIVTGSMDWDISVDLLMDDEGGALDDVMKESLFSRLD